MTNKTTLILNADDPQIAYLSKETKAKAKVAATAKAKEAKEAKVKAKADAKAAKEKAKKIGVKDFIDKPFVIANLIESIKKKAL